jgi:hypothetical protein
MLMGFNLGKGKVNTHISAKKHSNAFKRGLGYTGRKNVDSIFSPSIFLLNDIAHS